MDCIISRTLRVRNNCYTFISPLVLGVYHKIFTIFLTKDCLSQQPNPPLNLNIKQCFDLDLV